MAYALLIYQTLEDLEGRDDPARSQAYWSGWPAYGQAVRDAGLFLGGAALDLAAGARTLDLNDHSVQDGPFADTHEQLGGFFLLDVPDMETALMWAARMPKGPGRRIEVRYQLDLNARYPNRG